jgi:hypothetical protein
MLNARIWRGASKNALNAADGVRRLSSAKDAVPENDRAPRSLIAVYCLVAVGGVHNAFSFPCSS